MDARTEFAVEIRVGIDGNVNGFAVNRVDTEERLTVALEVQLREVLAMSDGIGNETQTTNGYETKQQGGDARRNESDTDESEKREDACTDKHRLGRPRDPGPFADAFDCHSECDSYDSKDGRYSSLQHANWDHEEHADTEDSHRKEPTQKVKHSVLGVLSRIHDSRSLPTPNRTDVVVSDVDELASLRETEESPVSESDSRLATNGILEKSPGCEILYRFVRN